MSPEKGAFRCLSGITGGTAGKMVIKNKKIIKISFLKVDSYITFYSHF